MDDRSSARAPRTDNVADPHIEIGAGLGANMDTVENQGEDLRRRITDIVIEEGMLEGRQIAPEDKLADIGIESADFVMILMAIEEKFGVYVPVDDRLTGAQTVGDLLDAIVAQVLEHQRKYAP